MTLSPESLFHFTDEIEKLKGIFAKNFCVKYCIENIESTEKNHSYKMGVPMVSFCDIPLAQIKNHLKSYGPYGIGLKKSWGVKRKLNPVLYLESNSNLTVTSLKLLSDNTFANVDENSLNNTQIALADFLRHIKNYQGKLIRKGEVLDNNYRFADEREWRYCPTKKELGKNLYLIDNINDYEKNKKKYNDEVGKIKLKFNPDDISYIIVKEDSEILDMVKHLKRIKFLHDEEKVTRLTTRIITSEQILKDF